jgi:tetratricopeptide (TPR) repeat protein
MKLLWSEADLPSAYAARGLVYVDKGEYERAIADLEKALELGLDASKRPLVVPLLRELRLLQVE